MVHARGFLQQAATLTALVLLAGCAAQPLDLAKASAGSPLKPVAVSTSTFTLQTLQPLAVNSKRLRVYIEGDGRAWITSRTVSNDPTPTTSMTLGFALSDPQPSVYMARPCQFIRSANCTQSVWTTARFSNAVVQAQSEVLDALKARYGVQGFELVGYSGGAAVALLLAARRSDVLQVQTLAGNIDPLAWTQLKVLTPLSGSLNPADYAEQLTKLPQRHFIGANDKVVPQAVSEAYLRKVRPSCSETVSVQADHHSGFEASWLANRNRAITCGN
ncbi:alpha/beta hydrolase [Pseudomonas fontis]|uniref:Alpha/beta hydrolase n=1 Tax=Pseudomonas fontis TaxID=2942633 RepID=A0ABT5NZZ2_9PSED|nr:alpha/beta hydrolase [Pseudomonas fontis]MDD0976353.1 alpha/beta hydrolase [Pseudomonas fontis]MDD0993761.1 alpha/beta hydrolase [Pseudomonas fontis]